MSRRRYTAESIIDKLREAEVEHARGQTVAQLSPSYQREAMNKLSILNGPKLVPRTKVDVVQPQLSRYSTTFAGVVELVDTRDLKLIKTMPQQIEIEVAELSPDTHGELLL